MGGTTTIQPPGDKTKVLYDAVSKDYDIGSYDEFEKKLQDPAKRKAFYDGVGNQYDLGSFKDFEQKVGGVKKKDAGDGSASPSASSPKPDQTGQPINTSGSDRKQATENFKNNTVTPKEVSDKPLGHFLGPSPEQISGAINNKGKNIDKWQRSPSDNYITALVDQRRDVDNKIAVLNANKEAGRYRGEQDDLELKNLTDQQSYLKNQIQKNYDEEKKTLVPELLTGLKGHFNGADWIDIYNNETKDSQGHTELLSVDNPLQWDKETNNLTPKSVKWISDQVDGSMNKKKDAAVNATVSGDLSDKKRTYQDLTQSIVDELNLVPVYKAQQDFTKEYTKKNPEITKALEANKDVHDYFSANNFDDVKAKVKLEADKSYIATQQRYYGEGGLFTKNQDYVGIHHKYADLVAAGKMSDAVARKQMDAEILQNPALKSIKDNYDGDVRRVTENSSRQYENYVIGGLKKEHPQYTTYKDGSIGLASISEDQYKNMVEGYQEGMDGIAKKMLGESAAAFHKKSNDKAKEYGPLLGSIVSSTNELASGLTKMLFNKTGWGGEKVRNFQADEIAGPQIDQSDVAATWNFKGWESLFNPSFYLSGLGKMVPVIAGGTAIGLATEGEGVPKYIGWLANAGLFTGTTSLSTYGQLLNAKDVNGNMLSESDAAHFAAEQAKKDFLPNFLMMAVGSGTLIRAKNIVKPSVIGAVGRGAVDAALQQPFFAWQGYNDYATMQEATGKKTDIYDYLQSKDFRDNLLNGMVMGGAFSLLHAPGNYKRSMDNWEKMVHMSEGEFKGLIPQNYALGQEMAGNGNYLRDALKMHIFNIDPEGLNEEGKRNLADLKNSLLYSTNLDRNIRQGNLDPKNIKDLYQAHNLALADQHDYLSEQAKKEGNKSLSDIYSDKAKDYREQAKDAANGTAKYHYLVNDEGHPIFMSDQSFKTLEQEGTIAKWQKDGTIKDVHKSDDPEFAQRYRDFVGAKDEATVEGGEIMDHAKGLIEENKEKLGTTYGIAKEKPELFYQGVSDQAHGITRDTEGNPVKSDLPDAEKAAREQYGDDIVNLAKVMYPAAEEVKPETEKSEEKKSADKESDGAYKPQIRDDYFAKADFFTPEEKEKFETLDDAGKDKMIDDKRAELKEKSGISVIQPGELKPPNVIPPVERAKISVIKPGEFNGPNVVNSETISSPIKTETNGKISANEERPEGPQGSGEGEGQGQRRQDGGTDLKGKVLNSEEGEDKQKLMKSDAPPPSSPHEVDEPNKTGISHEIKKEREKESGVEAPERGKGLTPEEGVQRGRDLLKGGADPEKVMAEFEKDGKISADTVSIARAKLEELAKETQAAIKKFGGDSEEANRARKRESDWAKRIQPMQTEWSEIGRRQQGATDIETGSFTGFERSFELAVERPMTEEEKKMAKELVDKVNELTEKQGKLEAKVKELLPKGKEPKTEEQSIKEKAKKIAQKIRENAKLNRPGMFMAATPASLVWDGAVEIVAKTIETGGLLADAIQRATEHIKASEWYKGLSEGKQKQAIDEFSKYHKDADKFETPEEKKINRLEKELEDLKQGIAKQKSPKSEDSEKARLLREQIRDAKEELGITPSKSDKPLTPEEEAEENEHKTKKLAEKFVGKRDSEFSEEEARGVWSHVSSNYLDKGADVPEAVQNTAIDLGMSVEQVLRAMATPKDLKNVSQEMWDIQSEKRKAINSARYFVENADKSGLTMALNKLPSFFFSVKTFGHGTVGNITHAGLNIFRPSTWAAYWPNVIKSFGLAYGSKANYEKSVFILQNKPHFNEWLRDGLAADPNKIYDEYQLMAKPEKKTQFGRGFQWLSDTGTRGFAGLNFMRYDIAEMLYNRASDAAKADPKFRSFVAELVNHATGHTDAFSNSGKVGKVLKVISFAPGLEVSRWQRMIIDPAKAFKTFSTWSSSTVGEKAAAKITAQSAGEKIALYGVLLAANAGLLVALGSKQRVNMTDPTQSDWLRFKFLNKTLDVSGNMTSPYRLLYTLGKYAYKANFGRKKDVEKSPGEGEKNELARQVRYKLSPMASDVSDVSSGTDAMGNVLPWSKIKPPPGRHKMTWDELIGQETLPIPVQAGIEAYHSAMEAKGMSKSSINGIMNGLLLFGIEGFTGAKYQDDFSLNKKK